VDSELLKTFLEVSRTRHFGRAAETLYLTQSAVSLFSAWFNLHFPGVNGVSARSEPLITVHR